MIRVQVADQISLVTMDDPPVNAQNADLQGEMIRAFDNLQVTEDSQKRCALSSRSARRCSRDTERGAPAPGGCGSFARAIGADEQPRLRSKVEERGAPPRVAVKAETRLPANAQGRSSLRLKLIYLS